MEFIDLRSDTVTHPTPAMRKAMAAARVGDDVYGDDPTVRELEEYAAQLVGKESALFVPSGTFGNQLSLFTHCPRGSEVILGDDCHIVQHEVGASAVIAGVQLRSLTSFRGELDPQEIESRIRGEDLQFPATSLICLENAHSNGRVISLQNMASIHELAQKYALPVHLDGARLFNAAEYLGLDAREMSQYADSVMFCLSKGLCAPVGSILAGNRDFITRARKGRKLMGGGLRQVGILAAAGLLALQEMRLRLGEDHRNARLLGVELSKIPGISIHLDDIHINMVFFEFERSDIDPQWLITELEKRNIKANPPENGLMRFVTHYWVSRENILHVAHSMQEILEAI